MITSENNGGDGDDNNKQLNFYNLKLRKLLILHTPNIDTPKDTFHMFR
jgi:hypothetical protein